MQRMANVPNNAFLEVKPNGWQSVARNKTPLARIREHITWIAVGKTISALLSVVYLGILTRALGPKQFGSFSLILSSVWIIQMITNCNIWQVVVRYGNKHINVGHIDALARLIGLCTIIDIGCALAGIVIAALVFWFGRSALSMDYRLSLAAFAYAIAFLVSLRNVPRGVLRLNNSFGLIFIGDAVPSLVKFFGAGIALIIGPSLCVFLFIWALSEVAGTALLWWYTINLCHNRFGVCARRDWWKAWRENEGLPSLVLATNISETTYGLMQQLPILLVGAYAGSIAAGLFRLANQLTAALAQLSGFINLAGYTEMANLFAEGGIGRVKSLFYRLSLISLGIALTIMVTVYVFGKLLILLMSGPAFLGAYPFLRLLGLACVVQVVGANCEPMLMAAGRSKALIGLRLAGLAATLSLLFLLLPTIGAIGAAWARVATESVSLAAFGLLSYAMLRSSRA